MAQATEHESVQAAKGLQLIDAVIDAQDQQKEGAGFAAELSAGDVPMHQLEVWALVSRHAGA
jgi:hypothetical protein